MKPKRIYFIALIIVNYFSINQGFGQVQDSTASRSHFELSFGQSILFISQTKLANIRNQAKIIVPTNAVLFFIEFRPEKIIRVPVFFNLPTETKQYIVNGQLLYERASPTFGSGLEFRVFKVGLDSKSHIELEIGPLISLIFDRNNQVTFAPILAGRVKLTRGKNFVMYLGSSYSLGIDAFGLLYGTGTVF